mmetsp:Transcript_17601/g.26859  ORF Transcript_17601/g.26859 Transcript_17601/m.26859 type:complete len:366 (-) Transcript_17601:262-1359(-)
MMASKNALHRIATCKFLKPPRRRQNRRISASPLSSPSDHAELVSILSKLFGPSDSHPAIPLSFAFGYGSGVFSQRSGTAPKPDGPPPMVDLIIGVDDPTAFHASVLHRHPSHYRGALASAGPAAVTRVGRAGGGVWFNPFVRVGDRAVKYGVSAAVDVVRDLTEWDRLYVAGRMQKPTVEICCGDDAGGALREARTANLRAALAAGLLLLPPGGGVDAPLPAAELHASVASLSYAGDVRLLFGAECPEKIRNLVSADGAPERWEAMYRPHLEDLQGKGLLALSEDGSVKADLCRTSVRLELAKYLPPSFRSSEGNRDRLKADLAAVVRQSSALQSAKGVLTAGLWGGIRYAKEKFAKGWRRKKKK